MIKSNKLIQSSDSEEIKSEESEESEQSEQSEQSEESEQSEQSEESKKSEQSEQSEESQSIEIDESLEDINFESIDEDVHEILIKYIPNLENAINIFNKETLTNIFNDFFDNYYKSKDLVDDYFTFLENKNTGLEKLYILQNEISYKQVTPEFYKEMYKNSYLNFIDILNSTFNNPLDLLDNNNFITNNIFNVQLNRRKLKIIKEDGISEDNIDKIDEIMKTNINESLYSKINKIKEYNDKDILLKFEDNDFDYINDIMIRYGKNIFHMTDNEYNLIPKLNDKKPTIKKSNKILETKYEKWHDDISKYYYNSSLDELQEDEIRNLLNEYTIKKTNLNDKLLFNNVIELETNISNGLLEVDDVYNNIKDYLKFKEIDLILNILLELNKNKSDVVDFTVKNNDYNYVDNVFSDMYEFPIELIEIIDNEEFDNKENIFFDNDNVLIIPSNNLQNNNFEKDLIQEIGIPEEYIDRKVIDILLDNTTDLEKMSIVIFYLYYEIQKRAYSEDLVINLNESCSESWNPYYEPLEFTVDNKLIFKDKPSVYSYIICCFKNITDNRIPENDILKNISKLYKNQKLFQNFIKELKTTYNDKKESFIIDKDTNFYKSLLNNINKNPIHQNYVQALKYIVPKKLKRINKNILGCCPQLLNEKYEAFNDIKNKSDDKYLAPIQTYIDENNQIVTNTKWNSIKYIPDNIEYKKINSYPHNIIIDENNQFNIDIKKYLIDENQLINEDEINIITKDSLLKDYVKNSITTFNTYKTVSGNFSLENFILTKCKSIYNLKILISVGLTNNHNDIDIDNQQQYDKNDIELLNISIDKIENICIEDLTISKNKNNLYIYFAAKYITLNYFKNSENANLLYNNLKNLEKKLVPTRDEYNKMINNYREDLKVKAIEAMELLTKEDKELAKQLKNNKIIDSYEQYVNNIKENEINIDDNNDNIIYKGDDENDVPL